MSEELGRIEKPPVEEFKGGRKLYFVPLVLSGKELPVDYLEKHNRYWEQVDAQIANLESKLGPVNRIFHELITDGGEAGLADLDKINENSSSIIRHRIEKGSVLVAIEDKETLAELMDWSRCLSIGLQSEAALSKVYGFYNEANNKRNELLAKKLNESLKDDETGILIMGEGHHVHFPDDFKVFYIAPPGLDELKRWVRDYEDKIKEQPPAEKTEVVDEENTESENTPETPE